MPTLAEQAREGNGGMGPPGEETRWAWQKERRCTGHRLLSWICWGRSDLSYQLLPQGHLACGVLAVTLLRDQADVRVH